MLRRAARQRELHRRLIARLVSSGACMLFLSFVALASLSAQTPPSPITFRSDSWLFTLGGYFKLDVIHDFGPIDSPDAFDPRSIPVDGSKGTNTRVEARQTRFSLGIEGPADGRTLEMFVEGDFYGAGNTFRMRHAFAQYGGLLAGQSWTTFMDEKNIPPTIDFETPLAAPLARHGQMRFTSTVAKNSDLAFAIEEADPEVVIPSGVRGTTEKTLPDITARFRLTRSRGHVQLSGFLGRTRFRADTGATSDVTIGGVLVSARLRLFVRDAAYAQLSYGPGLGRYRGSASAALDASGRLETIDVVGVTAGYERYWSAQWSSNAVVSPAWVVNEVAEPASDHSLNYTAVNLRYWFLEQRAWIGVEYLYGRRQLQDGAHRSAHRVQLATRFNILK